MTFATRPVRPLRVALAWAAAAVAFASLPAPAAAQYQWLDERNQMVFSDLAPPSTIPPERILRVPEPKAIPAVAPPAAGGNAAAKGGQSSNADREMAFRKRQMEQVEASRAAAAERARKEEAAMACNDARNSIRLLESGTRITSMAPNGERTYLSESERKARLDTAKRNVSTRC